VTVLSSLKDPLCTRGETGVTHDPRHRADQLLPRYLPIPCLPEVLLLLLLSNTYPLHLLRHPRPPLVPQLQGAAGHCTTTN
jgi:hypothetical protein